MLPVQILAIVSLLLVAAWPMAHACDTASLTTAAEQWKEVELTFTSAAAYENPYVDAEMHVVLTGPDGQELTRPAFWDGGDTWRVRFASPTASGTWRWRSVASNTADEGLHGQTGQIESTAYRGDNPLIRHGLLRMSPGHRNVIHADGTTVFVIGDTPWALPFRGTPETVTTYARNRQERGFNAALLMSVQPDRRVEGPRDRTAIGGFGVGFEDLPDGALNHLNPAYFQTLDTLVTILVDHGIVPVYNPVFQGFGWKGGYTLGNHADPAEYARYLRYLIARYGARPAMWLLSADGTGSEAVVEPAGQTVLEWDAYRQPAGLHYSPFDDRLANWTDDVRHAFHFNRSYQDAEWLDFQWAQTGHGAEHLPHKVFRMYENRPVKGALNGEPTYERIGAAGDRASGWWQGHEAWLNITSGGTMGHIYGAGGLWNWKLTADEPGWPEWANTEASWADAIQFDGSRYVGYVSRALAGLDLTDIERRHDLAYGALALAKESELYVVYLPEGGDVRLGGLREPLAYRWFNPRSGEWAGSGSLRAGPAAALTAPDRNPWVVIATAE